jgi:lipoate-protein ligase A
MDSIASRFSPKYVPEIIDDSIQASPVFQRHLTQLKDWNWRYGSTPEFSHHIETRIDQIGCFDLHYQVNHGKISRIRLFSDILYPDLVDAIESKLVGIDYSIDRIRECLNDLVCAERSPEKRLVLEQFQAWLLYELSL